MTDHQTADDCYDEGFEAGVMAVLRSLSRKYIEITYSKYQSADFLQEVKETGRDD